MLNTFRSLALLIALPALVLFCLSNLTHAFSMPPEGEAFVADNDAGTDQMGVVFLVNLKTGQRTVISDFGNPAQGPLGSEPIGIVLQDFRTAIVTDQDAGISDQGALFSVDLITGNRMLISNFGDPSQGPLGQDPIGVALNTDGNVLVVDDNANGGLGVLFQVDLTPGASFGQRTIISDFSNPAQGPLGQTPTGIVIYENGTALVTDQDGGPGNGALFLVDLDTGFRTVISNFSNPAQGTEGTNPFDVALDLSGNAIVSDEDGVAPFNGVLFQVDLSAGPSLGDRTVVSDFKDPSQGPLGGETNGVTIDLNGNALVTDVQGGTGGISGLFLVNMTPGPGFGDRVLISDFGDPSQGPLGADAIGVAFRAPITRAIPTLSEWGLIATAGILGLAGLYAVRRKKLTA